MAAILAADVVGYSKLMAEDEEGTHRRIKALEREVMEPAVGDHHGRVVNTTGDGFLVEFASPVEAVRCALTIQRALTDGPLQLRIGINLGDVIIEQDGDVYGEGVNIAARLEALCDPGGVLISGKVYDEIEGKVEAAFEDRGEQQVKNIAKPVRVYALSSSYVFTAPVRSTPLPLPDKPSIAVLPFTNMTGDPEQEYFADGIVEDIITALSRVKWFFVIARNSSFTYKGRAVDVRQVGRELGVRYALEGSIRRAASRVRITGQLVNAATGRRVWAEKFDGDLEDIFDLQDLITGNIVAAIEPSLRAVEIERARAKPTTSLDAYDMYLRALAEMHTFTAQGYQRARELLQKAVDQDPAFAEAWAGLADCLGRSSLYGWVPDVDIGRCLSVQAAKRAVEVDPHNGPVLALAAWTFAVMDGRVEQAADYAIRALNFSANSAAVLTQCSWAFVYNGEFDRAIECFEKARRLDPLDPRRTTAMTAVALAHFLAGRTDECIQISRRVLDENPNNMSARRFLAAANAQKGDLEAARAAVASLLAQQPSSTISRTAKTSRFRHPWMVDLYLSALRKAGLPE
jgi:adenylate cyclase